MSPMPEGHGHQYGLSPDHPSSNSFGYTLDSGMSVFHQPPNSLESSPEPSPFHGFESVPRTSPKPLLGLAQSLSPSISLRALVDPPELDYSWTSEDGHSTPSEMPRAQRHQPRPAMDWSNNALLAGAFPAEDRREIGSSGGVELMAAPYFLTAPFSVSPHLASVSQASYGPLFSEPMMSDFADEQVQLLDPAIIGHHGIHHGSPSVRSSSPSISISALGQAADTLVTPAPLHRVEPMARVSRQKELAMGGGTADMAMGVLGSEAMSSAWSGGSPGGSGIMAGQGLHGLHGANIGRMPALARPQAAVLNAVPAYIEIYWQHSHRSLPIVHRPSFEVASEDALRYAMAAMATQHLNTREDRIRGSQLHEYAWQEAKRVGQSPPNKIGVFTADIRDQCAPGNIQGMQAVFLCEYFARFRGRKTAVRPSKTFESLYSRVSGQQSLVSSARGRDCVPTLSSSFSSWSPQTSEPPSASSAGQTGYKFGTLSHNNPCDQFSPIFSFSPQQTSPTSDYGARSRALTHRHVSIDESFSFPLAPHGHEQSYSNIFSSQVVDQCVHLFDTATALGGAGFGQQQAKTQLAASREERWRSWLNAEAHRRLLAACFCLDHHAAAYFQQPHARNDINLSEIPLTGSTGLLWEAKSVDDWCSILESQPAAANPQYLPPLDTLSPEDVLGYTMFDQGIILCATFWDLQNQLRAPPSNNEHADHGLREDFGTPTVASSAGELRKVDKLERAANLFSKSLVAPIADAYIALQHTPLHDLLAVSGDSWVFSQKVLGRTTFQEHQKRLKAWAEGRSSSSSPTMQQQQQAFGAASPTTAGLEGLSSAKATIYAARSLVSLLDGLHCQGPRPYVGCISTYWTIYVSALIIWAYGHHHRGGSKANNGSSSSSGSSGSPNKGTPMSHEETVTWLRMVADISQPEHLTRVRGRREASAGVVSMVKKMLETDCVGGRSRLYVDAAVVLRKLAEGVNWRWF